ncbi:MAG: Gx transporter family protein [Sediminispirochaetaceae bacterium]
MSEKRLRVLALFASLCLFFSILELMIPKPIPFFRLGLANLPLLPALLLLSTPDFFIVVLLKVLGQAVVSGTLLSYVFIFSAAGSIAGALVMLLLKRLHGRWITLVGIGVAGALSSNLVQLAVSWFLIFGESTRLIAPLFLVMGTITGLVLGAAAEAIRSGSRWFRELDGGVDADSEGVSPSRAFSSALPASSDPVPLFRFAVGILMIPPFLLQTDIAVKGLQLAVCVLASISAGRKFRPAPGIIVFSAVVGAHLLMPFGEVLLRVFDFPVTAGALKAGAEKGISLVGLVFISRFAVSKELRIPGVPGKLLYSVLYFFEELTAFRPEKKQKGAGLKDYFRGLLKELDEFLIVKTRSPIEDIKDGEAVKKPAPLLFAPLFTASLLLILQWSLYFFL